MASSLEVAHHDYPEVVRTQADPELLSDTRYSYVTNGAKDYSHNDEDARPTHAMVFGIRRRNFWILLMLAIVLVGATIGGSVGGSLAVRKDGGKSSSSVETSSTSLPTMSVRSIAPTTTPTTTPTPSQSSTSPSTTYVAPSFSELRYINGTCPSSILQSGIGAPDLDNKDFNYDCLDNVNIPTLPDLMSFSAYTLQQCVDACSQYNDLQKNRYVGVSLDAYIARSSTTGNGANCWLKGSTAKQETKQWLTSAVLRS